MAAAVRLADTIVVPLVAATVFAFAAGSSSVATVTSAGHPLRWVLLFALLVTAAAWAWGARARIDVRGPVLVAAAFAALALVSAAWSVSPRLSVERAVTVCVLFAAAVLLAAAAAARGAVTRPLDGIVLGAAAVAVAGLVLLAVDYGTAVVPATIEVPTRYRGFGQDANTSALLLGVVAPVALWSALAPRPPRVRLANALAVALSFGSIVASGSRGGMAALAVGCIVTAVAWGGRARRMLVAVGAAAAFVAVGTFVQSLPQPTPISPPPSTPSSATHAAPPRPPRYANVDRAYPLDDDVGKPLPGGGQPTVRRTFLGDSGRARAWVGALHQVAERPLLGFGFGTEGTVFRDRYYGFVASLPENSYIGLGLQLGLAGLLVLAALVVVLARSGWRSLRRAPGGAAAAGLGALAAGLTAAVVQSYVYSVGNIASAALWIAVFLLPVAASARGAG